uniref:fimbrillin family protein n=1 Tax=Alistipes shahii TaxID=328814 RepID=UPI00307CBDA1
MYDFRPVRNEVCVYLKYHLELAVSGIFERREGSNDTNLKFQPQIMEKLRLLTLLFLTVVIAACQKDPTQNGSSDPDVVSFQGSASFKTVDPAEKGLDLIWNADVDRIGLFAADGETVEHANSYYAAFSSAANTQFVCPSQDRRIVWSAGAASRDFYAYYPYRTTYDDLTAVPVAIAAKQKGAAGATKHLKQLVNLYAVSKGVKGPVETVSLPFESVAAVIELRLAADRTLSDVKNITLRSIDGGILAFETGSLNLRNGAVTPGEQTAAEINYEIEGQATISRTPTSFFLAVNPVEAGKTLEVLVDYGEKHLSLGSVVVPESGIPGGKLTVFSLGYEFPQRIAEDLSANGTANTYLVTKPGTTYKFRATTKGNGVPRTYSYSVDGHPVTKSYS